jgi:hypothetical protein
MHFRDSAAKIKGYGDSLLKFPDHTHTHTHTETQTHSVEHLRTSERFVAEGTTYTTHNRQKGGNSICLSGFKSAIPQKKPKQTYSLYRSAIGIGEAA